MAAIFFHEIGHVYYLEEVLGIKNIKMNKSYKNFGIKFNDPGNLTRGDYISIYNAGILAGLFPILLTSVTFTISAFFLATIVLYFVGCKNDIKEIRGALRNENTRVI